MKAILYCRVDGTENPFTMDALRGQKEALIASDAVQQAIAQQEKVLGGEGRILVRPSGTEALLRVMVEASEESVAQSVANTIAQIIQNEQK